MQLIYFVFAALGDFRQGYWEKFYADLCVFGALESECEVAAVDAMLGTDVVVWC